MGAVIRQPDHSSGRFTSGGVVLAGSATYKPRTTMLLPLVSLTVTRRVRVPGPAPAAAQGCRCVGTAGVMRGEFIP